MVAFLAHYAESKVEGGKGAKEKSHKQTLMEKKNGKDSLVSERSVIAKTG